MFSKLLFSKLCDNERERELTQASDVSLSLSFTCSLNIYLLLFSVSLHHSLTHSLSLVWAFLTDGVFLDGSPSENHGSILVQSNPDHLLSHSLPPTAPLRIPLLPIRPLPQHFTAPLNSASSSNNEPNLLYCPNPSLTLLPRPVYSVKLPRVSNLLLRRHVVCFYMS